MRLLIIEDEARIAEILRSAMQQAGILALGQLPQAQVMADARRVLDLRLKALQARSVLLDSKERKTLPLAVGVASYALDSDTIDVHEDAMIQQAGQATETLCIQFPFHNYQILTDKTVQGIPTQFYVEKHQTVTIFVWPVPSVAMSLNYRRIRLLRDTGDDGKTADLWQRQIRLLTLYVAHDLALGGPLTMARVQYLRTLYEQEEKIVLGDSSEKGSLQFMLATHRGSTW